MNLDVNNIIMFFDKFAGQETTDKEEMEEQDAAPAAGSTGGGSVPKWADSYSISKYKSFKISFPYKIGIFFVNFLKFKIIKIIKISVYICKTIYF